MSAELAPAAISRSQPPPSALLEEATLPAVVMLGTLLAMLRRRKQPFLLAAILVPLLALLAITQTTPLYTGMGTVLYDPSAYAARELESILRADTSNESMLASQIEILHGLRLAQRLRDRFHLDASPEFNPALRKPSVVKRLTGALLAFLTPGPTAPQSTADVVARAVQKAIDAKAVKASRVLEVSFTANDPVLARDAANALIDLYIEDQRTVKTEAVRRANEWLDRRVAELRTEVEQAEARIAAYRAGAGLVEGVQAGLDTERISRLSADLLQARNDLADAVSRLQAAEGKASQPGLQAGAQAAIAPSVVALRAQQDQLSAQLESMLGRLGPNHPTIIGLRRQLADLERAVHAETSRVIAATEAEVRTDQMRIDALEREMEAARARIDKAKQSQVALNAMERDAQAGPLAAHGGARARAADHPAGRDRIARRAPRVPGAAPRAAKLSKKPAADARGRDARHLPGPYPGVLAGDDRRHVPQRPGCAREARAAVLRAHPRAEPAGAATVPVEEYAARRPLSPFAEQLRGLRAALWLGPASPRVIAITAARPAEGKTTIAIGLGRSAALSGERVIVLDCDVRQPSFGRLMRADGELGIADCLLGHASLEEVIRKDELTGMAFIVAGSAESNSLALFMSDTLGKLLERLRADYDLILLDAPPAFAMADARVIARTADATLLCVRWRDTPRSVVRNSLEILEEMRAKIVGVALTRVDARAHVRSGFADAEVYHSRFGGYFRS